MKPTAAAGQVPAQDCVARYGFHRDDPPENPWRAQRESPGWRRGVGRRLWAASGLAGLVAEGRVGGPLLPEGVELGQGVEVDPAAGDAGRGPVPAPVRRLEAAAVAQERESGVDLRGWHVDRLLHLVARERL